MKISRIAGAVALTAAIAIALPAAAQPYPTKAIRIIVPFAPGGGADIIARASAAGLGERFGRSVTVENRPGANTIIGTEAAANAPPDGYTLLLCNSSFAINPSLYKTSYDAVKSFAPIGMIVRGTLVLVVHPSLPVKNVKELIALAKAHPGELTYSSYGSGSIAHLAGELMKSMARVDIVHVPYKGASPAIMDVIAGRVSMTFAVMAPVLPFIQSGKVKALGLATRERGLSHNEFRTLNETGLPGFDVQGWNGLCAPAGVPKDIITKLHAGLVDTFGGDEARAKFIKLGFDMLQRPSTPDEFAALIRADVEKWQKVVKEAGIKAD
ncbi:MAG TPA: tripartite tricarboxylate transporter substrate binding protein [Burkholderiales bacterium]|nr:tripartite tricarboxylate transporter substrate binding protein [Burkholderiales bacterium]